MHILCFLVLTVWEKLGLELADLQCSIGPERFPYVVATYTGVTCLQDNYSLQS
jgi:hypothetical protein